MLYICNGKRVEWPRLTVAATRVVSAHHSKKWNEMQKEFLLPYGFKKVGWVMLALALVLGIFSAYYDFDYSQSQLLQPLQMQGTLINNYIVIGLWLGVIFIGCSRERVEDEMIAGLRLNALLAGFYLQAAFIIVATFLFNSLDYLEVMVYNLVTYPLIFLAFYRWMLWRSKKALGDGE